MTDRETCLDTPLIAAHLEAIRALCREFGVARREVFGSVCTPEFDPQLSDVDVLVEYPPDYDLGPWLSRHVELQARLETVLKRKVDLIMTGALRNRNRYFIQAVDETQELLYAA